MNFPLFIVGLPRSGSTLLSKIINASPDILCVNDLYYLQSVLSLQAAKGKLERNTAVRLIDLILHVISLRSLAGDSFIGQISVAGPKIECIRNKIINQHLKLGFDWAALLDATLTEVALQSGKKRWADKTPQNFLHIKRLHRAFPAAKLIFIFRDPRHVLASYKYADAEGHNKRRYHPVIYSLYWRTAVRRYLSVLKEIKGIRMIRYEDIIKTPGSLIDRLNAFLETSIEKPDLEAIGSNTSFKSGKRKNLTETENWICQKICSREMSILGYKPQPANWRLASLPELSFLTFRFFLFQIRRVLFQRDARKRIFALLRVAVRYKKLQ